MNSISWSLLLPAFFLAGISLLTLSSVSTSLFWLQLIWVGFGIILLAIFYFLDWRPFINYRWIISFFYLATAGLLVLTYFFAPVIRGTRSWLVFGPVQFQASEFMKVGLILVYAYFFSRYHVHIANLRIIAVSFLLVLAPIVLVILQPDLGSALILGALWFGYLLVSGLKLKHIAVAAAIFLIIGAVAWTYFLADYQRNRILGLFYPAKDPLGVNYSVIQSKIAIGSAGFFGKGYQQGTQVQLKFLPEAGTDFILAAFIEEWGWSAGLLAIAVFLYLIFIVLKIGVLAETNFEKFACLGAATVFSLHFIINVGSTLGLFPVVGLPFPFFSYGGSNLLTNFFLLGIIFSIANRLS